LPPPATTAASLDQDEKEEGELNTAMLDLESTIRLETCIEGQSHHQKNEMIVRKAGSPLLD
jgi:hypothetical protein